MMQTVNENKSKFTKKELIAVDAAKSLYHAIGRPGYKTFYDTLQKGLIHNCSISVQDAKNAFAIYGPDEGALMGKITGETPDKVDTTKLYQLSPDFTEEYKHLKLAIDILFLTQYHFF